MAHRILIAEDNEHLRRALATLLGEVGYLVVEADSGKEALRSINSSSRPFCLLITDLVMPDIEGLELIPLLTSHPKLPIIAISGAFDGRFLRAASRLGAKGTLHKPFSRNDLLASVESMFPKTIPPAAQHCT